MCAMKYCSRISSLHRSHHYKFIKVDSTPLSKNVDTHAVQKNVGQHSRASAGRQLATRRETRHRSLFNYKLQNNNAINQLLEFDDPT